MAEEGLRILHETKMTPQEHWEFLIQHGLIDRNGRVLVNRYFPTDQPAETNGPPQAAAAPETSQPSRDRQTEG